MVSSVVLAQFCFLQIVEGINRPFSNWVKTSDALLKHSKHLYHCESLQAAENLKMVIKNPSSGVDMMLSSTL